MLTMLILTLKTDQPEAELAVYDGTTLLRQLPWQAHRQLAETLHKQLQAILEQEHRTLQDLQGIVLFKGPGSFTGLRIGASVANALASSLQIPIVGATGEAWASDGIVALLTCTSDGIVIPEYGAPARTTTQKK